MKRLKFLLLSMTGILTFFIPLCKGKIPVVFGIDMVKNLAGERLPYVALVSSLLLMLSLAGSRLFHIKWLEQYHVKDSVVKSLFFLAGIILVGMICLDVNVPFVQNPEIGGKILTIALAGTMVIFITCSGVVEFVSVLVEPVMRPVFKLPGEAAVNMISSFVSSASVGVYFTEQYYENKTYTRKQACAVVTNFSVISVGYMGVLASIAGIEAWYGTLLISSFTLVLVMAAVMIRIPPLAGMGDYCIDGSAPRESLARMTLGERLQQAFRAGCERSVDFTWAAFKHNFFQALMFAQKTVAVMIPTVILVLTLVYYTPVFRWLGYPFIPLLHLLGIPDAAAVAPSVLVGIVEVSLPSILISGAEVGIKSAFFVVQLSILQIIFFSECGNAILSSRIPLKAWQLVLIFLVRTLLAMPLIAILVHILF